MESRKYREGIRILTGKGELPNICGKYSKYTQGGGKERNADVGYAPFFNHCSEELKLRKASSFFASLTQKSFSSILVGKQGAMSLSCAQNSGRFSYKPNTQETKAIESCKLVAAISFPL